MSNALQKFLNHVAYEIRVSSLKMTSQAGSGHPTSCLSAADIVSALFFYAMHFDPKNHENPNNDRFVLSKGHASPLLYAVWKELGILTEDDVLTYRKIDSVLEGHPTFRFSRAEAATGSLGQGLSIAAGIAMSAKMDARNFYTYCLLGDSEMTEGSVWEALEIAAYYKLDNLIAIIDCNRLGQSTQTIHEHHVNQYAQKCRAFGWQAFIADGHSMQELMNVFDEAKKVNDKPTIIIAKTFKGYGLQEVQDKQGFHGKAFSLKELPALLQELHQQFPEAARYVDDFVWKPQLPKDEKSSKSQAITIKKPLYVLGEKIPTRKAYGQALVAVGDSSERVVSLDAEVKNSTYAELFEEKYPDRFVQCFIAEQNMIGMAVGLSNRGKIPFVSTFGAFFTRAFDQIRMAAIGQSPLRLTGSHAGVSIGQDGPSQMALEDIALMRTLPNSIVFYPSDATSTYKLVELMANHHNGISYLRTTRMETPILYDNAEDFEIGGCKVLRQSDHDVACIIGAGVTLHEALKAYELLKKENIAIAVIDLYSIKPLAQETVLRVAQKSQKRIITVEDHYIQGGLGQTVVYALRTTGISIECLAVEKLPRSGKPEELMAWAGIDAQAIIKVVKNKIIT